MARRKQHGGRGSSTKRGPETHRQQITRLIEQGNAKDAFKEAKVLFRQEESAENRQLVERTYLLRIKALLAGGMAESAREVAGNFLEFGVGNAGFMQELVLLLPQLGLTEKAVELQSKVTSPAAQASLAIKFADRAVLHPEETPASMPDLRDEAAKVRAALAALDSQGESQAMEFLQSIPRSSPLAEWRFFLRGLAAFRRGDTEQACANWERLDGDRAAFKIARALLPPVAAEPNKTLASRLATLEKAALGEPILERLGQLALAMKAGDWNRLRHLVAPLQLSLRRIDPRWSQRLTEILLMPSVAAIQHTTIQQTEYVFRDYASVLEPLPWDPRWNRWQALVWEAREGNVAFAVKSWRRYLRDLESGCPVPGGESRQVQALVWRRIGEMCAHLLEEDAHDGFGFSPDELQREDLDYSAEAVAAFEQSLRLDPTQRKTHEKLIDLYEELDEPARIVEAATRLLENFPDDVKTMERLVAHHMDYDEPDSALRFIDRIRKLQPLNTKIDSNEAWARMAMARHLALQGRWQEGREQFARLSTLPADVVEPYRLLARQAAFEFKAKQDAQAEAFMRKAETELAEPTPLWLALAIETARYKLPKALQKQFNQQFKTAAARKATTATASALAKVMIAYVVEDVRYPGRDTHVRETLRYLGRTTRLKYLEPELTKVCMFLQAADEEGPLLDKLALRGEKLFPNSPFFLNQAAVFELSKGPYDCDLQRAHALLEKALPLAQASQNPADAALIPVIKESLSKLQDIREAMESMPLPPGGLPRSPAELQAMLADMMMNEYEDDDDDFFDDDPGPEDDDW